MLLKEKFSSIKNLSDSQKYVLDYIFDHVQEIEKLSIKELGKLTFSSPATIVRLCKNLGYRGFEDFKKDFLEEYAYLNTHFHDIDVNHPFHKNDSYLAVASKIGTLTKETVDDTLSLLDYQSLKQAVSIILKANNIHLTAISFPLMYGYDFQLKMRRIGKNVQIIDIPGEQLFADSIINSNDCALIISYSGETPTIKQMLQVYKRKKIPVIAITSISSSTLRDNSDIALSITTREKLYSKIAGFSNQISIKLVLDILYSCIFKEDYDKNYAKIIEVSRHSEPGRFSTSDLLSE